MTQVRRRRHATDQHGQYGRSRRYRFHATGQSPAGRSGDGRAVHGPCLGRIAGRRARITGLWSSCSYRELGPSSDSKSPPDGSRKDGVGGSSPRRLFTKPAAAGLCRSRPISNIVGARSLLSPRPSSGRGAFDGALDVVQFPVKRLARGRHLAHGAFDHRLLGRMLCVRPRQLTPYALNVARLGRTVRQRTRRPFLVMRHPAPPIASCGAGS
jgi:hypothetical protein